MEWPKPDTVNMISAIGSLLGGLGAGIAAWFSYWSIRASRRERQEEQELAKLLLRFGPLSAKKFNDDPTNIELNFQIWNVREKPIIYIKYLPILTNYHTRTTEFEDIETLEYLGNREKHINIVTKFKIHNFQYSPKLKGKPTFQNSFLHIVLLIQIVDTSGASNYHVQHYYVDKAKDPKLAKPSNIFEIHGSNLKFVFYSKPGNKITKGEFAGISDILSKRDDYDASIIQEFINSFNLKIHSINKSNFIYRFQNWY